MDHFHYKDGALHAENIACSTIAQQVGTPAYIYSASTIRRHVQVFQQALGNVPARICYAVKANSNIAILTLMQQLGCGADVVSEGEIRRALAANIAPEHIVFSGVGKTATEMHYALTQKVGQFNVESAEELALLNQVAQQLGVTAPVALRVNPDVAPDTHAKISTGQKESKFGIEMAQARALFSRANEFPAIKLQGLSVHIGSQILNLTAFKHAFERLRELAEDLKSQGHDMRSLDLGGGFGIPYQSGESADMTAYGNIVQDVFGDGQWPLIFEPGRMIMGNAGILLSEIIYIKQASSKSFIIADAAMNDLMRPAMYDAYHDIIPIQKPSSTSTQPYDVVGPVCETGDLFATDRELPKLGTGDLIALRTAGAYGATMSHTYNSRLLVPEVLVDGNNMAIIRPRPTYDAMLNAENIPNWL